MTDQSATPSPFDKEPTRKAQEQDIAAMQRKLAELDAQYAGHRFKPVARVGEVHMSRYTIEWAGAPLPEGTELFALEADAETQADRTEREMGQLIDERDRAEDALNKVLDLVLDPERDEWSSAYDYDDAVSDVEDRMAELADTFTAPPEPAPSAPADVEALQALVTEWRTRHPADCPTTERIGMREYCADQLEAVIRRLSVPAAVKDCLMTADVEALADQYADTHTDERGRKAWEFDNHNLHAFAERLSGSRGEGE